MIPCNGKPFLWYLLQQLDEQGIKHFVLLTGYLSKEIDSYFGDGSSWGWQIDYSDGPVTWDTGKRLWEAREKIEDRFLLLYSDNFASFPLDKVLARHEKNQCPLTFMVSKKTVGNIALDDFGIVQRYDNSRSDQALNYVEIGYMIADKKETFNYYETSECSFSSILKKMVAKKKISAWIQHDHYHSISDPLRWKKTEKYLKPKKVILIDRDGVINKKAQRGEYISTWDDFEWINDTRDAMKTLANKGFKFIVISNQAGIARKMITLSELENINYNLKTELNKKGVEVLDIYICPHHWDDNCDCRKPKSGMFYQASREWLFRLDKTLFVGDDPRDCQAAYNAGCKSILIGDTSDLQMLLDYEQPIFSSNHLSKCIPKMLEYFQRSSDL